MAPRQGRLTLEELRVLVDERQVDTVLVALTDMQGRLQGKRYAARHFLHEVVKNAPEACSYLLAVDVDMNTEAAQLLADSPVALAAFGTDVVEHYRNAARVELTAFNSAVTDWERQRGFERL